MDLLTGLGIVGVALALSARESLENLIASFIIFFDKPFVIGDVLKVQNVTGTVERIGFRSTRLRTTEKTYVRRRTPQYADAKNTRYVPPHRREDEKSNVEMQRIKEGKCKRCGEKWDPKHRCAKGKEPKNLYNCEATNDSNSEDFDIEETEDAPEFSLELDDESIPQVSLSAMTSIS